MDPLSQDLIAAAGHLIAFRLNALPDNIRKVVQDAHECGGWCEAHVGILNSAATVRLVLRNVDGRETELARQDHVLGE